MSQQPEQIKTTFADRASTGLVNAGLGAATAMGVSAAFAGMGKLFKINSAALKFNTPFNWKLTGAAAAVMGVLGFATANKGQEVAKEKAIADYMDPTKGSEKERSAAFDKQWDAIDKGDVSNLKTSTHFRDKVDASRAHAEHARTP